MTAVITAGSAGDTGNATVLADGAMVIASGIFGGATVELLVEADLLAPAPAYVFFSPEGIKVSASVDAVLTATIVGGSVGTAIDVSIVV